MLLAQRSFSVSQQTHSTLNILVCFKHKYDFVEMICFLQIFVHATMLDTAEHKQEALVEREAS